MRVRNEARWDLLRRWDLGDATMWVLVPALLCLGGGFLVFIAIFAGEPEWDFLAGAAAIIWGAAIAGLIGARGVLAALVLTGAGAFGGWVWEQFRDGASISSVTYVGGGYDGSHWVGHMHNYEERTADVTCHLEALSPEGDVIGTVNLTATDVRPNGGQFVEGEIDVPRLTGAAVEAERITPRRNLRNSCTAEIVD